jgi:hypothetical protein
MTVLQILATFNNKYGLLNYLVLRLYFLQILLYEVNEEKPHTQQFLLQNKIAR